MIRNLRCFENLCHRRNLWLNFSATSVAVFLISNLKSQISNFIQNSKSKLQNYHLPHLAHLNFSTNVGVQRKRQKRQKITSRKTGECLSKHVQNLSKPYQKLPEVVKTHPLFDKNCQKYAEIFRNCQKFPPKTLISPYFSLSKSS